VAVDFLHFTAGGTHSRGWRRVPALKPA
jgi:hypothetical protein